MRFKIRHIVIAMLLAFVLIPMLVTDAVLTRRVADALMDNIKRDVEDTAGEVADEIYEYLDRGETMVRFLARAPAFRLGTTEKVEQVLDGVIRPFPFPVHAYYVCGNDAVICRPEGIVRMSGSELRDAQWCKLAAEQGKFVWTSAYKSSDSGRPVIAGAAPVAAGKGAGGVVALEFDLEGLSAFLRRFRLGKRGTIFVVDSADRLVSHRRTEWLLEPAVEVLPILAEEEARARTTAIIIDRPRGVTGAREPRSGRVRGTGPAPGPRVIAWAPIEGFPWTVGVMVPLSEYYSVLSGLRNLSLLVTAVAFACALVLGIVFGGTIVRPIARLMDGTRRIAAGEYDHRVEVRRRNELGQLAEAFNSMAERLEEHRKQEHLALIGRVASGVIHDLRTPMAVIRTSLPVLLREDASRQEKKELAGIVNGAIDRMAGMTQDVLEYARSESSGAKLEPTDVRQFVGALEDALRHDFELSGMELRTQVQGTMSMRVDREKLARAFYNIAGNARDAMGERGTFSISASSVDHTVRFVLADTGPGIPEDIRDQLFEPFVTKGKQHGTGLGLAIAREIVKAHGGEIHAESQPGEGAKFVIDLPAEG